MYSLILMAALSTGVDSAPAWWHCGCHGGCYGCCSCSYWGGYCGGCSGYGCCSCFYGYTCNGYYGCYGCCGYCGGWGCHNCAGGCCGCWGCSGCMCAGYCGCWCDGYGCCSVGSCGFGYGGCYSPYCGCACCGGGYCGGYCWGPGSYHPYPVESFVPAGPGIPGVPGVGVPAAPGAPGAEPVPPTPPKKDGEKPKEGEVSLSRAKLVVEVPADAKLYIDDQLMKTTSSKRVFSTPTLAQGQAYYYEVRVEVVRDGKPVSETKRVIVRAGEEARANFASMEAATVTAKADR
jgi:uncharacterized protein (TIGR03000 family)